jgi:selenocysteine-specific elongation factor
MRPVIFGTAGHIDHGKTTLVRALTGQDTDRLPEEKARGISIDLGFAHMTLPSGRRAAFVDVPGHERFIRNMVAGVHGMDAVLLVVAADEGVMPQTREHLAILTLLGVERGLTVLTKIDAVEADWLDLVESDTREVLAGTFLAEAPIVRVSAPHGTGLSELVGALDRLADSVPPRDVRGFPRLPIDRVFTVRGFGTVVTGTLTSGELTVDQAVSVLPEAIGTRVRGLEVHGARVERAQAGQRVAVNLGGVERSLIHRGQVVAVPGTLPVATVAAVRLQLLPDAPPLKHRARVHTHSGTQEVLARVYFYDREELKAGDTAWAELRWEEPVVLLRGDRVLLRSYSPVTTIGGATVSEVGVHHRRREPDLLERLDRALTSGPVEHAIEQLARKSAPTPLAEVAREVGLNDAALREALAARDEVLVWDGRWLLHREVRERMAEQIRQALARFHEAHPLRPGLPRESLKSVLPGWDARAVAWLLQDLEDIVVRADTVALRAFQVALTPEDERRRDALLQAVEAAGLKPPEMSGLLPTVGADDDRGRDLVQWLVARGELVRIDEDLYVTRAAFDRAVETVRSALAAEGALGMSALREVLGTTRKYAVPLLERMDEARITRRMGDTRVLGSA